MQLEVHATRLEALANWVRQLSLDPYPFLSACCGIEFMAGAAGGEGGARLGVALPKASAGQADLLVVVGTLTERQAPTLRRLYDQMGDPKWVIAFGACAATGGMYQNYAVVPGVDQIVPVDVYVPGCPPRPEQFAWAIERLRARIHGQSPPPEPAGSPPPLVAIRPGPLAAKGLGRKPKP